MKRVIRENTFETNSSSMHSVSIHKPKEPAWIKPTYDSHDSNNYIHIELAEFGWYYNGWQYDFKMRLSYLITMLYGLESDYEDTFETAISKVIQTPEFKKINQVVKDYFGEGCNGIWIDKSKGYIDHQSMYRSTLEFLEEWGLTYYEFLFNDNVNLIIDNDNH